MKSKMQVLMLLLLIGLIGASMNVSAGGVGTDPYYIEGTVTDADGDAVSGATIIIERVSTGETNLVMADGTSKTTTSDPPKVVVTTNTNGNYSFECLNLEQFADDDEFKITATKGDDTGSVTINIDIDAPPGYNDADIEMGEEAEAAVAAIDQNLCLWGVIIVIIILAVIFGSYSRRNASD